MNSTKFQKPQMSIENVSSVISNNIPNYTHNISHQNPNMAFSTPGNKYNQINNSNISFLSISINSASANQNSVYRQNTFTNTPDVMTSLLLLKYSMQFNLSNKESEKPQSFTPKNQYNTHPCFPSHIASVIENPVLFEKLPTDSLFLAFYHQQGSYQQFLASKQLKKQSWRYHKKYMTWFQRHDEPKTTSEDFEEGTYVYFDYESGWCPRLKSEFKFDYCYLEDEL